MNGVYVNVDVVAPVGGVDIHVLAGIDLQILGGEGPP